ncbi:MAG: AAA domain-containing protein [bacterium]|nr:AAA domain-containing protein [bacterium]
MHGQATGQIPRCAGGVQQCDGVGYKGNSVETLVADLLSKAEGNPRQAEKGIVFVDEIDKIRAA